MTTKYRVKRDDNRNTQGTIYFLKGDIVLVDDITDVDDDDEIYVVPERGTTQTGGPGGWVARGALVDADQSESLNETVLLAVLSLHDIKGQQADYIIRDYNKIKEALA